MNERFSPHNTVYKDCWNVGIYVRLSDEDRGKKGRFDPSQSILNQQNYIKSYIEKVNAEPIDGYSLMIHDIYSDDDYTGMNFNRPSFQRMMKDIDAGIIDCVVVKNLSRLGRSDSEMQQYLEVEFEKKGRQVRVIAIGDHYDSLYNEVTIGYKVILMMNREYSEQQHRNVTVAMRSMQRQGKFVGAFAPYGYIKDPKDKHHFLADEYAAEVIKRIFNLYLRGISPKEIAAILTRDGVVNPSTYKKINGSNFVCCNKISENEVHWTSSTVKHILCDETYTGTLVQHKQVQKRLIDPTPTAVPKSDWIRFENAHEAIISREDWQIAQSMMKTVRRDRTKEDEVTIFKGILKCGDCGHAMRKKWDVYTHTRDGKTAKYLYYNCATYRNFSRNKTLFGENAPTCTSHYISDKVIREIVLDDINKIISQVSDLRAIAEKHRGSRGAKRDSLQSGIRAKEAQISKYQNRLKAARNKLYDGEISDEEYREDKAEISAMIEQLEKDIAVLKKPLDAASDVLSNPWIQHLTDMGSITELDRATVVELISAIYVYEDRHIRIVYRFSDEFDHLFARTT